MRVSSSCRPQKVACPWRGEWKLVMRWLLSCTVLGPASSVSQQVARGAWVAWARRRAAGSRRAMMSALRSQKGRWLSKNQAALRRAPPVPRMTGSKTVEMRRRGKGAVAR